MPAADLAAVTVIGNDRPGIVAAVTGVLYQLGSNLKDATSTILTGHFAMMLVIELPEGVLPEKVEQELRGVAGELDLIVTVRPVEDADLEVPQATHMISVYGGDRPGIVFRVADHLARREVNITDLSSRVLGADMHPVYALMLEVATPSGESLETGLAELKEELGVEVSVHPIDADLL